MIFKTMDQNLILAIRKLYPDKLTQELQTEKEYFSKLSCPRCQSDEITQVLDARKPFRKGRLIPNNLAKCGQCGIEFEPYTLIEVVGPKVLEDLI